MELKEEGRSVWLVATLGPFGPGVKRKHLDERCRGVSTDQTRISVVTDEALRVGVKVGAGARNPSADPQDSHQLQQPRSPSMQ